MPETYQKPSDVAGIETRLHQHIETTNEKLDILIDLTTAMATVQERQNRQTDDIKRLETQQANDRAHLSGMYEKFDIKLATAELERKQVVQRIFDKIEDAIMKKTAESLHMHEDVEKDMEHIGTKIDKLSTQMTALSNDVNSKTSFTKVLFGCLD